MSADSSPLTIRRFDKTKHDRSAFTCGFAPIDNFLKSSLSEQIKAGMVQAWMATSGKDPSVQAFYTLGAMAVRADLGPKAWQRARIPDVPVIYIRAVAVHTDQQGRGLGAALMVDAMRRCLNISEQIGATAIVLDVLEDDAYPRRAAFYEGLGFRSLGDSATPNRVFVSMADVRASFADLLQI